MEGKGMLVVFLDLFLHAIDLFIRNYQKDKKETRDPDKIGRRDEHHHITSPFLLDPWLGWPVATKNQRSEKRALEVGIWP